MAPGIFQLPWHRCPDGYRLEQRALEVGQKEGQSLVVDMLVPCSVLIEPIDPLAGEPALFRRFLDMCSVPEGCLEFANRYGELMPRSDRISRFFEKLSGGEETAQEWILYRDEMLATVGLWEALQRLDMDELRRLVQWRDEEDGPALYFSEYERPRASSSRYPERLAQVVPGDLVGGALLCLTHELNRNMKDRIHVTPQPDMRERIVRLQMHPDSLLTAMWLQLAQFIESGVEHRKCPTCGRWFEVSPRASRKSRLFCRDSCRVAHHRARQAEQQEQAKGLTDQGKKPAQIARELGVELAKVKEWLKGK